MTPVARVVGNAAPKRGSRRCGLCGRRGPRRPGGGPAPVAGPGLGQRCRWCWRPMPAGELPEHGPTVVAVPGTSLAGAHPWLSTRRWPGWRWACSKPRCVSWMRIAWRSGGDRGPGLGRHRQAGPLLLICVGRHRRDLYKRHHKYFTVVVDHDPIAAGPPRDARPPGGSSTPRATSALLRSPIPR